MRLQTRIIVLLSIVLAGIILLAGIIESRSEESIKLDEFVVQVRTDDNVEDIRIWGDTEGECYVFLPGYARLDQVFLVPGQNIVVLDGVRVSEESSCENIELNKKYPFSYIWEDITIDTTLTFVQSANVPSMYIDTYSGSMDYIHEKKGNKEPGTIRIYTNGGELDHRGNLEFIKSRGNATWDAPKKPYSIKLSYSADLLGMGSAEKWILLADAYDDSNLRNKIGLDLAQKAGMEFTPDCQWVDLYLNGKYVGLYLLSERNEVHNQRVDISDEDSFLVSMELKARLIEQKYPHVWTEAGNYFRIHHSSLGEGDLTALWQSAENAILAEDGVDPVSGKRWEELIDVDSWALRLLVDEIIANYDGGSISQFFYYDAANGEGQIKAGPVWDQDNSLAHSGGAFNEPNVIAAHREHTFLDTDAPLFSALYRKPVFRERLIELYRDIFLPLLEELVNTEIQKYAEYISSSANMNRIRWYRPDPKIETEKIRTFLEQRISFLNDYWLGNAEYHLVHFVRNLSTWKCLAVRSGETVPDVVENTAGWFAIGTKEAFDLSQPIFEDVTLVQGDMDFQAVKELVDGRSQPSEEADSKDDSENLSAQSVLSIVVFLVFLMVVFSIDMMRSAVWKRRGDRKSDTYTVK